MEARVVIVMSLISTAVCLPEPGPRKEDRYRDPTGLWQPSGCGEVCDRMGNSLTTKIPDNDSILSRDDFDKIIVGRMYSKFYHAMTKKSWFSAVHFFTKIQKINGTSSYRRTSFADNECYRSEYTLTPIDPESNKAHFTYVNNNRTMAFFSSCPDKYYIKYFCSNYETGQATCAIKDTMISVYLPDSAHDIPLFNIVADLFRVTGVRFGAPGLMWTFTYGQNVLCNK